MIGIAISFDLGRYHANPWGAHVNEGLVEWPPSPWRILRALYAVSRADLALEDVRAAADRALDRLIAAGPPSYSLPVSAEGHSRHYLPSRAWSPAKPANSDLVIDAFRAIAPEDELVVWWQVELGDDEHDALERTVCSLGHLGRSEALCSARLLGPDELGELDARPAAETSEADVTELLCPTSDATVEDIAVSVAELRRQRLRQPPRTHERPYEVRLPPVPATTTPRPAMRPEFAMLRLGGPNRPGIAEAVAVAQALRAAAQARFGHQQQGGSSATFSGRAGDAPRADQHRHAHYLVLPGPDRRRVERVVVWAPEGMGEPEVTALATLRRLTVRGACDPLPITLAALGTREAVQLPELLGPSRQWSSLTPFGLVRHPKMRGGRLADGPEDQIRLELARRGLPEPTRVQLLRGSWHRFRSSRVGSSRLQRARVYGARLEFSEPVEGPLALGALCHFGLGVFRPARS